MEPVEPGSPRGRLALLENISEGKPLTPAASLSLDQCLGCRACEAACPAGVKPAREIHAAKPPFKNRTLSGYLFVYLWRYACRTIVPKPSHLVALIRLLDFLRQIRLTAVLTRLPPLATLGAKFEELAALLPPVPSPGGRRPHILPAVGPERRRVAFFAGCIMETVIRPANDAAITLLRHAGCTVIVPPAQTCCGALSHHSGDRESARKLALRNIEAFRCEEPYDCVVSTAAACTVHLREYPELFPDHPAREKAAAFSARVRDFAELVSELKPVLTSSFSGRIAYHESCLLRHSDNRRHMKNVLALLPDVEALPAPHPGCCGSAGGYVLRHPDVANALLDAKITAIRNTGAKAVVTDNPGCLLFLRYGLKQQGLIEDIAAYHLAEFLLPGK